MHKKIPLFDILEKGIILLNGSYVISHEVFLPSFEGIEERDIEEDINIISNFLKTFLKDKSIYVSFLSETTKRKNEIVDRYIWIHKEIPLNRKVAEQKSDKVKENLIRRNYLIVSLPVFENKTEFFKIKDKENLIRPKYEEVMETAEILSGEIKNFFLRNYGVAPHRLSGEDIWKHLFVQINSDYLQDVKPDLFEPNRLHKYRSLREQLFLTDFYDEAGKEWFIYNGKYIATIHLDILPETVKANTGIILLSKIPFPCRYVVNIELPNQVKARTTLSNARKNANIFVFSRKGSAESEKNKAKVNDIDELLQDVKSVIVKVSVVLYLEDTSQSKLSEKILSTTNIILSELKTSSVYINKYKKHQCYITSLGYFPDYSYGFRWTTLQSATRFIPIRGSFIGTIDEPVMLFGNRFNSITCLNFLSKRQSRWSFIVIGPTGSGKSFITNHILLFTLSLKPIVVVFDLASASSYRTLTYIYDGEYIEARPGSKYPTVKNPFDFPLGNKMPSEEKYIFFDRLFSYMLTDKVNPLSKEDYELLKRAIGRVYQRILYETPKVIMKNNSKFEKYGTWINLRDEMLERALKNRENIEERDRYMKIAEMAHRQAMPTLIDLASVFAFDEAINSTATEKEISQKLRKRLNLYIDGVSRSLFAGTTNFETTKNFIVINLGYIKENENLLIPTYLAYRENFWEKMTVHIDAVPEIMRNIYGDEYFLQIQQKYKFLLIDEYHNFNTSKEIIRMTDKDFRQGRTFGVAVGVITQSLKDIMYEQSDERYSIFESASNKIFLRHTTPQNPQKSIVEYVKQKTGMNEKDEELFTSLSMLPGRYSEAYYFGEDIGKGVLRYEPLPIELWINTTHKNERYIRDMLIDKCIEEGVEKMKATEIVVSTLAEMYPNGLTNITEEERNNIYYRMYGYIKGILRNTLSL